MRSSRFLHPLFCKSSANDRCLRQADLKRDAALFVPLWVETVPT
jgi:hypothetical protein